VSASGPDLVKAWSEQAGAFQELIARLMDKTAAGAAPPPLPFAAPWKEFADKLGIGGFKADDPLSDVMPALGLSREYQEIARRLLELSRQFQQCYAELAQQHAMSCRMLF
jgi:hypothetical protein